MGYNDASHFNREYERLFGRPPVRNVERLRHAIYLLGRLDPRVIALFGHLTSASVHTSASRKWSDVLSSAWTPLTPRLFGIPPYVLRRLDGVREADVSFEQKEAGVEYDDAAVDREDLTSAIEAAGYTVEK